MKKNALTKRCLTSYLAWQDAALRWSHKGRRQARALSGRYEQANKALSNAAQAGIVVVESVEGLGTSQYRIGGVLSLRGLTLSSDDALLCRTVLLTLL